MRFSSSKLVPLAAAGLLVFMFVLAWGAARQESVTFDETAHIGAGLSYLQRLDMRLNEEHPPLSKMLAAVPLVASGVWADYSGPVWTHSSSFFAGVAGQWIFGSEVLLRWNDARRTLMLARMPMMLLTLILGWCVFHFTRRLGGDWAGILCLAVYVSSPVFLAMGPLVMTDVALALFALLAVWTFATLWREPARRNVVIFSLSLAGAILSKFSAPILFLAIGAFIAISLRWPISAQPLSEPDARRWRRERLRAALQGVLLSAAWVYLFCLVLSWNQPMDIPGLAGAGPAGAAIGRMLMPAWVFFRGVVLFIAMAQNSSYILGHDYWHGVWFYFPVLLALKSAPGFIGLLALLCVVPRSTDFSAFAHHRRMVWVSCAAFAGTCILSHYNTEIRHLSFPITLLIVMISALPRGIARLKRRGVRLAAGAAAAVLALSCMVTAVRAYPYFIPYTSAFGMGRPAWMLVNAGNLDYNQCYYQVGAFARSHGLREIRVEPRFAADVTSWLPQGRSWNCQKADAADSGKWVAVSSNILVPGRACAWLWQYPHESLGGGSMFAVQLPATIPASGTFGRPPVPPPVKWWFGLVGDVEPIYNSLLDHPETFPTVLAPFETAFKTEAERKTRRLMEMLRLI